MEDIRETTDENRRSRLRLFAVILSLALVATLGFFAVEAASPDAPDDPAAATETATDSDAADGEGAEEGTEATGETEADNDPESDRDADGNDGTDEDAEAEETAIPVETVPVARESVASYLSATANLVPENEVRVLAEWEGRVARLHVEEGQAVAAGQILAELADEEAEIALEKARVEATNAEQAFSRAQRLMEQELLAQEAFERTAADHRLAQQTLAEAEWRLEKTRIRAPFAGRVTERRIQTGQHVRPGQELFTVADFDPLIARIYLPERDVLGLDEGRTVHLTPQAAEDLRFAGRIRQISPVVDTATGTVKVTVEASSPPRGVRPGAFVRVDVVRERRPDALVIPKEALVRELRNAYVFVAADGEAQRRELELGIEEGASVEVRSGLEHGERVIVAGQGGLQDGARVEEIEADPRSEKLRVAEGRIAR